MSFKGSNAEQTRGLERDTSNRVTITKTVIVNNNS